MPVRWSAAEVARWSGVPVAALPEPAAGPDDDAGGRLYGPDDLVGLQHLLVRRELGLPEHPDDPALLLGLLVAVRDRLDRQLAAVRGALDGTAVTPSAVFDGFGADPAVDEDLDELAGAWARVWAAGEPVDSDAARAVAARHRAVVGAAVPEALVAVLDRHGLGVAAYARDALAAG